MAHILAARFRRPQVAGGSPFPSARQGLLLQDAIKSMAPGQDHPSPDETRPRPATGGSLDIHEARMRETLGLPGRASPPSGLQHSTAARPRHRFAQDGEVPVTVLGGHKEKDGAAALRARVATLESDLHAEQAARARAEQALRAGNAAIQALETRLAHMAIASREALAAERTDREQAEAGLRKVAPAPRAAAQRAARAAPAVVRRAVKAKAKPRQGGKAGEVVAAWLPGQGQQALNWRTERGQVPQNPRAVAIVGRHDRAPCQAMQRAGSGNGVRQALRPGEFH